MTKEELKKRIKGEGVLRSAEIEQALSLVDRADFVTPAYRADAYEDYPLPIGKGQTISQPTTVVFMLELLNPRKGQRVLDVGAGSGWTTALLAALVGEEGHVFGVERVPELAVRGRENVARYDFSNAEIVESGVELGVPDKGPFDRILVSAAARDLPEELVAQLAVGGVMVLPVQDAIWRISKRTDGSIDIQKYPGFAFVPLVGN